VHELTIRLDDHENNHKLDAMTNQSLIVARKAPFLLGPLHMQTALGNYCLDNTRSTPEQISYMSIKIVEKRCRVRIFATARPGLSGVGGSKVR